MKSEFLFLFFITVVAMMNASISATNSRFAKKNASIVKLLK